MRFEVHPIPLYSQPLNHTMEQRLPIYTRFQSARHIGGKGRFFSIVIILLVVFNPVAQNLEWCFGEVCDSPIEMTYDLETDSEAEFELEFEDGLMTDHFLLEMIYVSFNLVKGIGSADWSSSQEIDTPPPEVFLI